MSQKRPVTGQNAQRRPSGTPRPAASGQRPAANGARRPMSPAARRAMIARRKRQQRRNLLLLAGIVAIVILAVVLILTLTGRDKPTEAMSGSTTTPAPTVEASAEPTATPEPTAVPDIADPARAALRPAAPAGWLPVFKNAQTQEKIIAITVDDCYQADNLRMIIDCALENGAKLTIFPIGENVLKPAVAEVLKYAWENGMELENHTFTHNGLYGCTDEDLANEIYLQNLALNHVLGVNYQCHFLRPKGGDAKDDQRIHAYLEQQGYYGVAHWNQSGGGFAVSTQLGMMQPGDIFLYHTTDKDLAKLLQFIPAAVQAGYRLVTLNEMFGYPENAYTEGFVLEENQDVPQLQPYHEIPVAYEDGSYAYGVLKVQARLIELGWMADGADGIFGEGTAAVVKEFQTRAGLPATGKADLQTQQVLFSENAPVK